jgi:lipoprotein NlpI
MARLSRKKRLALFIVLTALLSLAVLEFVSAMLYYALATPEENAFILKLREGERGVLSPHPYALFMPTPDFSAYGFKQHDSLGFRGPEIDKVKHRPRVVCLGGSTTYGWMEKDPSKTFPAMMERDLSHYRRVEVVNAGMPMASSAEILATLQFRVLPIEPDLVLLHIGLNDVYPELMPGYKPDYTHDRRPWEGNALDWFPMRWLFLRFNITKLLALSALRNDGESMAQFGFVVPEHSKWRGFCESGDADSEERYVGFRDNLRGILAICAANGITVVVTPTNVRGEDLRKYPALSKAYSKNISIMRGLSKKFPMVYFFDSRSIGLSDEDFIDMCHTTPHGAALKAEAFSDFIAAKNLLGGEGGLPHVSRFLPPVPRAVPPRSPRSPRISRPVVVSPPSSLPAVPNVSGASSSAMGSGVPRVSIAGRKYLDAYTKSGKDAYSFNNAARCYMREGLAGEAASALRKSLSLDPDQLNVHGMLGAIYAYHLRKYPEGSKEFSSVLDLRPGQSAALSGRGWCELMMDDIASAKQDFDARVTKDPKSGYANMSMGVVEYFRGTRAKAMEWFRKGAKNAPRYLPNHLWMLVLTGGVPESGENASDAVKALAELYDGAVSRKVYVSRMKRGGLDSAAILFFLGECAESHGDGAAATGYYKAAMACGTPSVFRLVAEKKLSQAKR